MSRSSLGSYVAAALGCSSVRLERVHGGDIGQSYRASLPDGTHAFVKSYQRSNGEIERAEARGLDWLREAGALRLPEILYVSPGGSEVGLLVLEYLTSAAKNPRYEEELGRGLALLHSAGAESFGAEEDGFIGPLAQANRSWPTWSEFYRQERLLPLIRQAHDAGSLDASTQRKLQDVLDQLDFLCGPAEAPARLHGDLWGGNQHVGPLGEPCLIDPAAYGGHREMDLAMMRLFGGYGARVFAAYEEAYPLSPGHEARVALYQLYPLLVHLRLFGSTYGESVRAAATRALAP